MKPTIMSQLYQHSTPTREDFLKEIVELLVQRRKELGLSQEEIDQLMGNADRLCSKWECGHRTPTAFNLFCWVEALDSKIYILNHEDV